MWHGYSGGDAMGEDDADVGEMTGVGARCGDVAPVEAIGAVFTDMVMLAMVHGVDESGEVIVAAEHRALLYMLARGEEERQGACSA